MFVGSQQSSNVFSTPTSSIVHAGTEPVPVHLLARAVGQAGGANLQKKAPSKSDDASTVLIMEDETPVRSVIERILKNAGINVLSAENGKQGLDLFSTHRDSIDLMVIDLSMPVVSGAEAFEYLCATHVQIPIILMSGYNAEMTFHKIDVTRADHFLQKPFPLHQLLELVQHAIAHKKAEQSRSW